MDIKRSMDCAVRTRDNRIKELEDENERLRKSLTSICTLYCAWYDTGHPSMTGAAIAYELNTIAAYGLSENE